MTRQGGDPTRVVGRRILGAFLEGIIDAGLLVGLASLLGIDVTATAAYTPLPEDPEGQAAQLVALSVVYLAYWVGTKVVTLSMWGWTPGMLFVGVRCVRWDGRPPSILRALLRSAIYSVYAQFGCLFILSAPWFLSLSKGHKGLWDMAAGTFVVDNQWYGHMVIVGSDSVTAGPMSVHREEAAKLLAAEGIAPAALGARLPPNAKNGNPFLDKDLDTYVVWNKAQERFLAFDKATGTWEPLD